jgi:hypothetical protein
VLTEEFLKHGNAFVHSLANLFGMHDKHRALCNIDSLHATVIHCALVFVTTFVWDLQTDGGVVPLIQEKELVSPM